MCVQEARASRFHRRAFIFTPFFFAPPPRPNPLILVSETICSISYLRRFCFHFALRSLSRFFGQLNQRPQFIHDGGLDAILIPDPTTRAGGRTIGNGEKRAHLEKMWPLYFPMNVYKSTPLLRSIHLFTLVVSGSSQKARH